MQLIISGFAVLLASYFTKRVRDSRSRVATLLYFEIIYNLIIKFVIGSLGLPSFMNYVSDAILLWLLVEYGYQHGKLLCKIPASLLICFSLLLFTTLLSYALNVYSPLLYLWGFRNNFRFIIFAIMCAVYLEKEDIEPIFRIFWMFFVINILVVTYQAFFVDYQFAAVGDYISGLFSNGQERGGNGSLNWLMCIVCAYQTVKYLNDEGSLAKLSIAWGGSIYMSAVAEIKMFFVLAVVIGFLSILMCKKSLKIAAFFLLAAIGLSMGIQFLYFYFPDFADFFQLESILAYATRQQGYSSASAGFGVDRLTAIPFVLENFLKTPLQKVFGIGMGNADFSGFSFLVSDLYRYYSNTGYTFFSSSFIMAEFGVLGFFVYMLWYMNFLWNAFNVKAATLSDASIKYTVCTISILVFFMLFINQTMRLEASGYMVSAILVFPYIMNKKSGISKLISFSPRVKIVTRMR